MVKGAYWQENRSQWQLIVQAQDEAERIEYADILVSARGFLSQWNWPSITGIHDFKGQKVHSAGWDHGYDYSHKRIAVIGNGSSGIQILPKMAELPRTEVISFQRGPTWVVSRLTPAKLLGKDDPSFNPTYTEEDKKRFRENPDELKRYRKLIQGSVNQLFRMFVKGSPENLESTDFAKKQMASKLNYNPELCQKLIPQWELGCRRYD